MTFTFDTEEQITNFCRDWLRKHPLEPSEWLTPGQVRAKYAPHLSSGGFHKRLKDAPYYMAERAWGSGRLLRLVPNHALIAHLSRPKAPGRRG